MEEILKQNSVGKTEKPPKWRNLHFTSSGKSYRGRFYYNSEEEANASVKRMIREHSHMRGTWNTLDGAFDKKDYSHSIPMPIKGE